MFSFGKAKAGFSSLHQDSEGDPERDQMLDHNEYFEERKTLRSHRFWSSNVPWMLTTLALSIYIIVSSTYHKEIIGPWSPTDVGPARPIIEESMKTFTAGLDYNNPNHTLQHTPSTGRRYVGPPSPDIDAAWEDLAGIQEIYLTREEAIAASVDDTYIDPLTNLYEVEIESLHHLHCLNYIRKSIDIDHYPDIQAQAETWRIHLDHCIDSIREFIMCKADMTPIILIPPERSEIPVPLPEFRTTHVCRNFEKLNNWVKLERAAGTGKEGSLKIAQKIREKTGTKS